MASLSGTFTAAEQATTALILKPGGTITTSLTFTGSANIRLEKLLGSGGRITLGSFTANVTNTYKNDSQGNELVRLRAESVGGGASVDYVFAENNDPTQLFYDNQGRLIAQMLDDGTLQFIAPVSLTGSVVGGGEYTDSGTRASPNLIVGAISVPTPKLSRIFIKGSAGPVLNPTLSSGSTGQRLRLFATDNTDTVTLNDASNIQLSGVWVGKNKSILELEWDNSSKWVEGDRNEI